MGTKIRILYFLLVFLTQIIYSQDTLHLKLDLTEKKLPFGLVKKVPSQKPIVSLVLSGGGARALSHVGVLRAIEDLNISIDHVIGTSMGSVLGGLYAAGYSIDDLDSLVQQTNWEELFFVSGADRRNLFVDQKITEDISLLTVRLDGFSPVIPQSINTGKKISKLLTNTTLNAPLNRCDNFDKLLYKYRAVATELLSGNSIVLDSGSLSEAMRASSSVSFLLPPIQRDSLLLVDGGVIENLPIRTAERFDPDIIIASDATSPLREKQDLVYPWEIGDQLVTIPSRKVWEASKDKADILITHDLNDRTNDDFSDIEQLVRFGYSHAYKMLSERKDIIDTQFLERLQQDDVTFTNVKFDLTDSSEFIDIYSKFNNRSEIKKSDLLFEIYKIYEKGDIKEPSLQILKDSLTTISINFEYHNIIRSIKYLGVDDSLHTNELNKYFNGLLNKPYNSNSLLDSIFSLVRSYRSKGFMLATVKKVEFDEGDGVLIIEIDKGFNDKLSIVGNDNTMESVISREFNSVEGALVKKEKFEENLNSLYATDLFDNVCLSFEQNKATENILKIRLNEKLPNVLRFGLRIDDENFTQLALDIRNENLFGGGSELGFSIGGGPRKMDFVLEHKTNRIFDTYLTYKAQGYYKFNFVNVYADDENNQEKKFSRSKVAEYRQRYYGGFIGIGAHLKKLGTLTTELKYESNEVEGLSSFPTESEFETSISSLKFRLQIDSQNKYPYPTKGIYINTFYETAQDFLGGDVSFAKFSFDYAGHFSIGKSSVLSPKFIFGFADETLPLSQQFNFGGQSNFFGYREYEFRGRQIFITSLQYMYKLPFKLYFDTYFKMRYDLGSSWIEQEQIQFEDLKHGLGVTLSFDTPIGPADFSVGRSLKLEDTTLDRITVRGPIMFYFTIGYYY